MIRLLWRPGIALGLGWLIALLAPTALAGPTPTPTPADDVQDLLFLGGPHPVFIRLHVRAGDLPLHAAWRDAIRKLSSYLDPNGAGTFTPHAAARAEWP